MVELRAQCCARDTTEAREHLCDEYPAPKPLQGTVKEDLKISGM